MKHLVIVRHAKTKRAHPDGDRARELTGRGRRNAGEAGQVISARWGVPDLIVSSPASRALQTAHLMAEIAEFEGEIREVEAIYEAEVMALVGVITSLDDEHEVVALIGHNPGVHILVDRFCGNGNGLDRFPTAACAFLDFDVGAWEAVGPQSSSLVGTWFPTRS